MGLPQGCCCWDLPNGTMASGIFTLVLAILITVLGLIAIGWYDTAVKILEEATQGQVDLGVIKEVGYGALVGYIIIGVIYIAICSLLIHGVRKENRCLFFPWMILTSLQIIVSLVFLILGAIAGGGTTISIVGLVIGLLILAFFFYMLLVVISYYRRLQQNDNYRAVAGSEMSTK